MAEDILEGLALRQLGSTRGNVPKHWVEFVKELGEEELPLLLQPGKVKAPVAALARVKTSHHLLARLLAEGRKAVEASAISGYSQMTIAVLQNDPAFQELVAHYKALVDQEFVSVQERLATLGDDVLDELSDRVRDPDKVAAMSVRELKEILETALDRSSAPKIAGNAGAAGPQNSPVNFQVNFVSSVKADTGRQVLDITLNEPEQ